MRYVTVGKSHFERKKERKKIGLIFKFFTPDRYITSYIAQVKYQKKKMLQGAKRNFTKRLI